MGRPKKPPSDTVTREEVIGELKKIVAAALAKGNLNAAVNAVVAKGKTLAMFTDVSLQDHRFVDMTPQDYEREFHELVADDLIRGYMERAIADYKLRRSGSAPPGESDGGLAGGEDPASGSLPPEAASAAVPRTRIH